MIAQNAASTGPYCRKCGYSMQGLVEHRCPECGRPFNPTDSGTFLTGPHSWTRRRRLKRIGQALAGFLVLAAVAVGSIWVYVYWEYYPEWKAEQRTIAVLKAAGVRPVTASRLAGQLEALAGPVAHRWLDRVGNVFADGKHLTDADFAAIKTLRYVWLINLDNSDATDDQLMHLREIAAGQFGLVNVSLTGNPRITDAGLVHVPALGRLAVLSLGDTSITDRGLIHVGRVTRLMNLDLHGTQITDAGLQSLVNLKNLRTLDVSGTGVTAKGVDQLQKALPAALITGPSPATAPSSLPGQ